MTDTPAKQPEIVVFNIRRDTQCSECRAELGRGSFLRLEHERVLCLDCADLDHLEYLPRGNTAITRRASKHSSLRAVVLQWSRSRHQYERQGILAEPAAIRRAEEESLADADLRARRREQAAVYRDELDQQYVAAFAQAIRQQFPGCPEAEAAAIAEHACRKHSGRVGRSAAAKQLEADAIRLAVIARIRHQHTRYDAILMRTDDRALARAEIRGDVEKRLAQWAEARPAE